MTVFCDDACLVPNLVISPGITISGPVGLAVKKSRLDFKQWKLKSVSGPIQAISRTPYTDDDPYLVDIIERDILDCDLGITFDDIASLEDAKRLLDEAVTLPLIIPEFFTGEYVQRSEPKSPQKTSQEQ